MGADDTGRWKVELGPLKVGGPWEMSVAGNNTVTIHNVAVGEVWVCSGQSNMEMGIGMVNDAQGEIAAANLPNVRLYIVPHGLAFTPQTMNPSTWSVCTPESIASGGWSDRIREIAYKGKHLDESGSATLHFASTPEEAVDLALRLAADPNARPKGAERESTI